MNIRPTLPPAQPRHAFARVHGQSQEFLEQLAREVSGDEVSGEEEVGGGSGAEAAARED